MQLELFQKVRKLDKGFTEQLKTRQRTLDEPKRFISDEQLKDACAQLETLYSNCALLSVAQIEWCKNFTEYISTYKRLTIRQFDVLDNILEKYKWYL